MSRYAVYITPDALAALKALPAELRRHTGRLISKLADDPSPGGSRPIDLDELRLPLKPGQSLRCLRLDGGRIIYAASETRRVVDVLAVRARPPYDYDYIKQLIAKIK